MIRNDSNSTWLNILFVLDSFRCIEATKYVAPESNARRLLLFPEHFPNGGFFGTGTTR